jgi:hypothetical protein
LAQEFMSGIGTSPLSLVEAVSVQEPAGLQMDGCGSRLAVHDLNALALRSLVSLFEDKENLFCRRVTLTKDGFYREATSWKRTIIALLGLQRLAESGATIPFDVALIRGAVLKDTSWVKSIGDLGLLTWLTAACAPARLGILLDEFDFGSALESYWDGRQARTTGLAWFLAGIAHARLVAPGTLQDLTDVAVDAYHLLQDNQSEGGIFGRAAFSRFFPQIFYNRFGSFADQMHAIYGLTTFARAFQIEEPLASALACANSVRALQGEMGQWWFLYDKRTCRIVNHYPILSLHQDGIAPVGFFALGETTGQSFDGAVHKGLSWIAGANELGDDLRNLDRGLIWDSIGPRTRMANYWEAAFSLMNISHGPRAESLQIRYEARPDHFGWLLYAFGGAGLPKLLVPPSKIK